LVFDDVTDKNKFMYTHLEQESRHFNRSVCKHCPSKIIFDRNVSVT